jgi:hypothetical protein
MEEGRLAVTVTLNLKPELEAGVLAQAQASGKTVEAYLLSVVETVVFAGHENTLPGEQRAAAFEAWAASHRATPPLSDYAVSREGLYEGPSD